MVVEKSSIIDDLQARLANHELQMDGWRCLEKVVVVAKVVNPREASQQIEVKAKIVSLAVFLREKW